MSTSTQRLSAVIPTYRRERVLVETIESLLGTSPAPDEILVMDQLPKHIPAVTERLSSLEEMGCIRWLRLDIASIPHAMNVGLLRARGDLVLFVDDDIIPVESLVAEHIQAHQSDDADLVVGRVYQPWGIADLEKAWEKNERNSGGYRHVEDFIGCNFSVKKARAEALGGFDENFVGAAYRYEAEFSSRVWAAGGTIVFAPHAEIQHLQTPRGGTRAYGRHLNTIRPHHAVGEYYFLMRGAAVKGRWRRLAVRPLRAVRTRFHLKHPWWIPLSLLAEVRGFFWALRLFVRGPKLIESSEASG